MQLLSVKSAAKAIEASPHTIYRAIHAGELRSIDIGVGATRERNRIRIDADDLRAWVESRASKPNDQVPA